LDVVVLNGARAKDQKVDEVTDILQSNLALANISSYRLRDIKVADCLECFNCWVKTPGQCIIDDAAREIAYKMPRSDLIIYVSPIVFGGYSYELKKVLDRQISGILPFMERFKGEVHHPQRYEKRGKLAAIGVLPAPDASSEEIFETLLYRNSLNKQALKQGTAVVYESDDATAVEIKVRGLLAELEVES
jgi:multimeric flavodoxin WrbA